MNRLATRWLPPRPHSASHPYPDLPFDVRTRGRSPGPPGSTSGCNVDLGHPSLLATVRHAVSDPWNWSSRWLSTPAPRSSSGRLVNTTSHWSPTRSSSASRTASADTHGTTRTGTSSCVNVGALAHSGRARTPSTPDAKFLWRAWSSNARSTGSVARVAVCVTPAPATPRPPGHRGAPGGMTIARRARSRRTCPWSWSPSRLGQEEVAAVEEAVVGL